MTETTLEHPKVVTRAEWLAARKELLAEEKHSRERVMRSAPSGVSCPGSKWTK
jgi:predicted dithiol-disulfide oxidoreductase (DUF899 family)